MAPVLLEREPEIVYGPEARRLIAGKTGAGGSIGSEIVRQVRSLSPTAVFLVDHDEGALHALQLELNGHGLLTDPQVVLADIRDSETMFGIFADIAPEVAGVYPRILKGGEMDAGGWSCGMVAGLIHDVPTCKELIDRIMAEAESLIRQRLEGFLAAA